MHHVICAMLLMIGVLSAQTVPISQFVQCEDFNAMHGATFNAPTYGEPRISVKNCGQGDWLRYTSINFMNGEYDSIAIACWTVWEIKEWNTRHQFVPGSSIVVWADSLNGVILATVPLASTVLWGYSPAEVFKAKLARITGTHSVILTFSGADTVCEIDNFCLTGTATINTADAVDYYVSTLGNDGFTGDIDHPFKTIQHAASLMKPGSRCYIRQGIYRETVRPLYTGLAGAPLTFMPFNGEQVFISGADPVTGWTPANLPGKPNVYKAPMKWSMGRYSDQLLIDGKMAVTARAPNVNEWYDPFADWIGRFPTGLSNWSRWKDSIDQMLIPVMVPFGNHSAWSDSSPLFSTKISQPGFGVVLPTTLFGKPADFFKGGLFHLYNDFWKSEAEILSSSTPDNDNTIFNCSALSSVRIKSGGNCYVSSCLNVLDAPNEWLRVDSTAYVYTPGGDNPSQHLVEAKKRNCGFDLTGKQYVTISGIKFIATSATLADAKNCVVDACEFKYLAHYDAHEWVDNAASAFGSPLNPSDGSRGIYVSGENNTVKNCLVAISSAAGIILTGKNQEVTNCRIRDIDYSASYYAGVFMIKRYFADESDAAAMNINHNTIYNCGRATINFQGSADSRIPSNRHRIQYNDLGRFGWLTSEVTSLGMDGGASRVDVSYNWFHGGCGGSVTYFGCDCGWGCWQSWLHHNVFWNAGAINEGTGIDRATSHWVFCQGDTGAGGSLVFNNTCVDRVMQGPSLWDETGTRFNNIYASGDTIPWKFTNPDQGNYSLRAGSPAIDNGIKIPAAYAAALGYEPSYAGTVPDLGAYEGGTRWVAGANWQERAWVYPPAPPSGTGSLYHVRPVFAPGVRQVAGKLLITWPEQEMGSVHIYNAKGALVFNASSSGPLQIATRGWGRGMYYLRIAQHGRTVLRPTAIW